MTGLDTARGRSFFVEIFFKCSPSLRRHSQFKFPIIIPGRSERKVHAWSKDPACQVYDVYGVHRRGICRKYRDGSAGSGGGSGRKRRRGDRIGSVSNSDRFENQKRSLEFYRIPWEVSTEIRDILMISKRQEETIWRWAFWYYCS